MGAIKDIVDLCIKLRDENRDGKVAAALSEIQSLTLKLQSEQASLVEKNADLVKENLALNRKVVDLENVHRHAIAQLEEKHRTEMARIAANQPRPFENALDEIATKMLVTLANADDHEGVTDGELIQHLRLTKAKGDYHFDQLRKRKFVDSAGGQMGRGTFWFVTSAGRDYMAKAGLL